MIKRENQKSVKDVTGGAERENLIKLLSHKYRRDNEGVIRQ